VIIGVHFSTLEDEPILESLRRCYWLRFPATTGNRFADDCGQQ